MAHSFIAYIDESGDEGFTFAEPPDSPPVTSRHLKIAPHMRVSFLLLALASYSAISADIDWQLVPDASPEGQAWVDVSTAKFRGSTVIATFKWEYQGGTGYYLASANCANSTITQLGGEFRNKDGTLIPKDQPDPTPVPAPTGTFAGNLHRFMCDLRPAGRKPR